MPDRERTLLVLFGLCWLTALAQVALGYPLAGSLPLDLYGFYGVAAAGGWLCGNLLVSRRAGRARRRLLLVYLLGPLGPLYLLHTLGPAAVRRLVPLAPLWAFCVFTILFLVPVSLRK